MRTQTPPAALHSPPLTPRSPNPPPPPRRLRAPKLIQPVQWPVNHPPLPVPAQEAAHANTPPQRAVSDSPPPKLPPRSAPLQEQLKLAKLLMPHWYKPNFSRKEAISYLRDKGPGWFIVRDSVTVQGGCGLSVKALPEQIRARRRLPKGIIVIHKLQVILTLF